ncbi:hypothetical protein EGW08_019564 [Elysia chlorotica]|uniref:Uncharacterized protein n=1 Tax=Elysia chlorotica TaxID=188477 RepID=A0A433STS9_ELYCH|nr:hypothetical protein EGW08_019564 [Elysia chlorotica]
MTKKKKKVSPTNKYSSVSFKVEETVVAIQPKSVPVNLAEEKARFLKTGLTPRFEVQDISKIAELAHKTKNQIRFDLQGEAEYILEYVRDQYGDGELFLEHAFGSKITKEEATPMVLEYINENSLSESLRIHWCDNLACSAKMVWRGPVVNANKPELRKYSLWINWSDENNYMRESGIKCLMDHEIGTHLSFILNSSYFRLINDGFQPWFSERTRFNLRSMGSFEGQCTEEGLASIHTALRGRVRLLWSPALAYYTACKAAEMSFKELFDHLGRYTSNIDFRWKQVMRVKRGLADPRDLGGFGNDQCYFEGAVKILRNMDNIDFNLLMSGKICMDEVDRIKRVVRKDVIRFPTFMKNMAAYRRTLKKMLTLNGLDQIHGPRSAPAAFTRRLEERKQEGDSPHKSSFKKVRSKPSKTLLTCKFKSTASKNTAISQREKNMKSKSKEKLSSLEVEMFPVSNSFVNTYRLKRAVRKQKEQEARTAKLEQNVRDNIASLDLSLSERIEQLRSIVRDHTWSNSDSSYRDSLINEASNEVFETGEEYCTNSMHEDEVFDSQDSCEIPENERTCKKVTDRETGPTSMLFPEMNNHLDADLITSNGIALHDFDQLQEHKKQSKIQSFITKNTQHLSNSLLDFKVLKEQETSDAERCLQAKGGPGSARSKLMSKRKLSHQMSASPATNSNELHGQCVNSEYSLDQARWDLTANQTQFDKTESRDLSDQQENAPMSLTAKNLSHSKHKLNKNSSDYLFHSLNKTTAVKGINCSDTEVFTKKQKWHSSQKRTCLMALQREKSGAATALEPGLSLSEKSVAKAFTQSNEKENSANALVKFRMPRLPANAVTIKGMPDTDKNNNVSNVLITRKSLLSKTMDSERQVAGLKLDSLAKKKHSYCVDVSLMQHNTPLIVSQAIASNQ